MRRLAFGNNGVVLTVMAAMAAWTVIAQIFDQFELTVPVGTRKGSVVQDANPDNKPLLVLHIGPSKTGTSTIQEYAAKHSRLLRRDKIFYMETQSPPQVESLQVMQYDQVLISEEMFDDWESNPFALKYLLSCLDRWNVRIVYTYRRCHDWMRSRYFESHEDYILSQPVKNYLKWPEDGGKEIVSFQQVLSEDGLCPSHKLKPYRDYFQNIEIFNMHQNGGSLTQRFFCEMIPEATHLCQFATTHHENKVANSFSTKSPIMYFDQLVVAAHRNGLLDRTITRSKARSRAMRYGQKIGLSVFEDFPLDCLSDNERSKLLDLSLEEEKVVVPTFHVSNKGEYYTRQQFASDELVAMFCFPNATKYLEESQEEWGQFFASLKSPGSWFLGDW